MIKVGKLILNICKLNTEKDNKKRRKNNPPYGRFIERINVPYVDDNDVHHQFDVIYAPKEKRKNCLIIDIHGGAYMFCEHQDNYHFACVFVEQGYDVITIDYRLCDGKTINTKDQVDDIALCMNYIFSHLKELELEHDDSIAIMGDSAGGHFALLISEAISNKDVAKALGYEFPEVKICSTLLNCPVYDFVNISKGTLTKSGQKRMFGPNYEDEGMFKLLSPRTYIKDFKLPLFVSTCKQDFIGYHSKLLNEDMQKKDNLYHYEYIDSDEKHVGHVHNLLNTKHPLGKQVNDAMMDFIELSRKQK